MNIINISISSEGEYTVQYVGNVPQQGGPEWGVGNMITNELNTVLGFIETVIVQNKESYINLKDKK